MNEYATWVMYFGGLVAIKAHPRNEGHVNLDYCAQLADDMLATTKQRFPEGPWQDGPQQHKPR